MYGFIGIPASNGTDPFIPDPAGTNLLNIRRVNDLKNNLLYTCKQPVNNSNTSDQPISSNKPIYIAVDCYVLATFDRKPDIIIDAVFR